MAREASATPVPESETTENAPGPVPSSNSHVQDVHETATVDSGTELSQAELYELEKGFFESEAAKRPLVSSTVPLKTLREEYANESIGSKIDWLVSHGWQGLRRSRGDGDCFYRSFAYAYVERLTIAPDINLAVASSLSTLDATLQDLESVGFERVVFEDFFDVLRGLIQSVVQLDSTGKQLTPVKLLERFQDPTTSNSIVVFLRLLTSAHMRINSEDFSAFLFDPETYEPVDVKTFCERQVEPTGKEADEPQVLALCRVLKVPVDVAYVAGDRATPSDGHVNFVRYESETADGANPITLLYRPGHYDILERVEKIEGEQSLVDGHDLN